MKRLFVTLFSFFFFPLITSHFSLITSFAQDEWQIDKFDSQIAIQSDGKVNVTETIDVDFKDSPHHGIYRYIPYVYHNDSGHKTYTQIDVTRVNYDGAKAKSKTTKTKGNVFVKIGDPEKTITGKHHYLIEYTAVGILGSFDNYDEIYWNVTGNDWEVPSEKATATVILPKEGIVQLSCYQGPYGSTNQCQSVDNKSSASFSSSKALDPGDGMTVAVGYTKGLIPILTVPPPKTFWQQIQEPQTILAFLITFLTGASLIIFRWWTRGRDFWFRRKDLFDPNAKEEIEPLGAHETTVVEYEPPKNLRPAEAGALIDQKADTRDVTATIIHLATRGYLTITEEKKSGLLDKKDYTLKQTKTDKKGLLAYESYLLDSLFETGDSVKISSLKKAFYQELAETKNQIYKDMISKKFFPTNPENVRTIYYVVGAVVAIAAIIAVVTLGANSLVFLAAVCGGIGLSALVLLLFAHAMPRRTAKGHDLYRQILGYCLFVNTAEKYRQRFFEDKNLFNEILPYAIVFGITQKFAKAMKDIGLKPASPGWYYGAGAFNYDSFGSSMSDFSNSVGATIASTPSGSGSGGGGSSGGGGGGGGGGGW